MSTDPLTLVAGWILLFGIPALFGAIFWALMVPLVRHWQGRDVMDELRPSPVAVHDAEVDLGVDHPMGDN